MKSVFSIILVSALAATVAHAPPESAVVPSLDYATAYWASQGGKTKPLLILVNCPDCPPCRRMLAESIPQARAAGYLDGVEVGKLDVSDPLAVGFLAFSHDQFPIQVLQIEIGGHVRTWGHVGFLDSQGIKQFVGR
jgi:hypothetical protein